MRVFVNSSFEFDILVSVSSQAYPKVSKIYFGLLEILFRNHMALLTELDPRIIRLLVVSLRDSIQHHDVTQVRSLTFASELQLSRCCLSRSFASTCSFELQSSLVATAFDHIFSHTWRTGRKRDPGTSYPILLRHLSECSDVLQSAMNTLLGAVLFDNVSHNWALCRPIFSLLLTNETVRVFCMPCSS